MPLTFTYPEELPVSKERDRICAALRDHQVIIVCGDTGSGKTTQLPKMIAEVLTEPNSGKIAITQPRRLAATRMAARVAEECKVSLGQDVGVRVRFDDRTSKQTHLQFMTDGLLLAQLPQDPMWKEYGAIMIDEAHERSLNIDFLLGCIHDVLPKRPDLKIILSSATLDAKRFSEFFGNAPVLEVEGRLFPIQDEFLPDGNRDRPISDRVMDALDHLDRIEPNLDTLVFLPGEREIRETQQKLQGGWKSDAEILPLFARLGGKDQDKAFKTGGRRRVILATNVAETSVTIPGIRAVIDTGEVRLQRFHPQSGIQRLVTESVSQASAKQRRGRCGRTGPGICLRLYSEEDLTNAPMYMDPEIRRSSLAEVLLRMAVLGLPPINNFPLLDPPKGAAINQGYRTLMDIGAMTSRREITKRGRVLATFPLEPRLARMLEEGDEENVVAAVLVVVGFLSIQDPRERPAEKAEKADQAHAVWRNPDSDFMGTIQMWNAVISQPSQSKRNRFCRDHFLHPSRVREWINLVDDLRSTCKEHRWQVPSSVGELEVMDSDSLHRSILAGVPRTVGQREDKRNFRGANGQVFQIFPGSALANKPPKWVMAFSLMETSRIWARESANLRPEWIEQVAPHLCKAHYERPVWNATHGFVEAEERLQFGQLTLRHGTKVHYGRIDPQESRKIFLEDGLVPARLPLPEKQLAPYRDFLDSLEQWEHKLRRPGAFTGSSLLIDYFDQLLPRDLFTSKAFSRWSKQHDWVPNIGTLLPEDFRSSEDFPDTLQVAGKAVGLEYRYAPENPESDGVTFVVQESDLHSLPDDLLEWTAPGWIREKIQALIRSLDKKIRTQCAPFSKTADDAYAWLIEEDFLFTHSLTQALAAFLAAKLDRILAAPDFNMEKLPPHLCARVRVVDTQGETIFEGDSFSNSTQTIRHPSGLKEKGFPDWEGSWKEWPPGELPIFIETDQGKQFLAVCATGGAFQVRGFSTAEEAEAVHLSSLATWFAKQVPDVVRFFQKQFPLSTQLQLSLSLEPSVGDTALEDVQEGILQQAIQSSGPLPRSPEACSRSFDHARGVLFEVAEKVCSQVETLFDLRSQVHDAIEALPSGPLRSDLEVQRVVLWRPGWYMEPNCLNRYPFFLKAILIRIERASRSPEKDRAKFKELEPALDAFAEHADRLTSFQTKQALLQLEELRLATFAPELKTQGKRSHQRFKRWLETL